MHPRKPFWSPAEMNIHKGVTPAEMNMYKGMTLTGTGGDWRLVLWEQRDGWVGSGGVGEARCCAWGPEEPASIPSCVAGCSGAEEGGHASGIFEVEYGVTPVGGHKEEVAGALNTLHRSTWAFHRRIVVSIPLKDWLG